MTDRLTSALARSPVFKPGHVWLTGAGPGDPGLLTLHAVAGLAQADVVVHDALVDGRVLAMARADAPLEFAGKRGGKPSPAQADITGRLIALAREGRRVLRLKGGDPCMFGRGGEEAQALAAAGIPFRIIPGVTSGLAALSMASIPATCRGVNRALILVTGQGGEDDAPFDWGALATALIKGELAPSTPAAVIVSATLPSERILISELQHVAAEAAELDLEPPAIIAIGAIVAIRSELLTLVRHVPEPVA